MAGKGKSAVLPLPSSLPFISVFALSKFRGSDHLGAWNSLGLSVLLLCLPTVLNFHFGISFSCVQLISAEIVTPLFLG